MVILLTSPPKSGALLFNLLNNIGSPPDFAPVPIPLFIKMHQVAPLTNELYDSLNTRCNICDLFQERELLPNNSKLLRVQAIPIGSPIPNQNIVRSRTCSPHIYIIQISRCPTPNIHQGFGSLKQVRSILIYTEA